MSSRTATIERKSKETISRSRSISMAAGTAVTSRPALDSWTTCRTLCVPRAFDVELEVVSSDTQIDIHHTNETSGSCWARRSRKRGNKAGIHRFGSAGALMEGPWAVHC